ncbi:hypothetical protein L7F22_009532 [Adiantum nelumboides]|nr:hypothetical protein [Adiantum nelumboides]
MSPENKSNTMNDIRQWVSEHKLRSVGMVWVSGVAASLAYNWSRPHMKTSVKIMHARVHSQALTLGALVAAAGLEYYERKSGQTPKPKQYDSVFDFAGDKS